MLKLDYQVSTTKDFKNSQRNPKTFTKKSKTFHQEIQPNSLTRLKLDYQVSTTKDFQPFWATFFRSFWHSIILL